MRACGVCLTVLKCWSAGVGEGRGEYLRAVMYSCAMARRAAHHITPQPKTSSGARGDRLSEHRTGQATLSFQAPMRSGAFPDVVGHSACDK